MQRIWGHSDLCLQGSQSRSHQIQIPSRYWQQVKKISSHGTVTFMLFRKPKQQQQELIIKAKLSNQGIKRFKSGHSPCPHNGRILCSNAMKDCHSSSVLLACLWCPLGGGIRPLINFREAIKYPSVLKIKTYIQIINQYVVQETQYFRR